MELSWPKDWWQIWKVYSSWLNITKHDIVFWSLQLWKIAYKKNTQWIKQDKSTAKTSIEIVLYFQKYMYSLLQRLQSKKNCLCNKKLSN